jgi:flagellar hook assembly protein FlgD
VPVVLGAAAIAGKASTDVRVDVFDITGRRVVSVFSGSLPAGEHLFEWDGRTSSGKAAGAGLYFMRVRVEGEDVGTAKIMRIR